MSSAASFDAIRFARAGDELAGEVPATALERLRSMLADPEGTILYRLKGYSRKDGKPAIALEIQGEVSLSCQRCLEPVRHRLRSERSLVFVPASRLADFEDEEDDTDYLPVEDPVEPLALVDEEAVLSLPMSPRHQEGGCSTVSGMSRLQRECAPQESDLH